MGIVKIKDKKGEEQEDHSLCVIITKQDFVKFLEEYSVISWDSSGEPELSFGIDKITIYKMEYKKGKGPFAVGKFTLWYPDATPHFIIIKQKFLASLEKIHNFEIEHK